MNVMDSSAIVPPALMTAAEFAASAMVIPVRDASNPSKVAKLEVPPEHGGRMESMRREVSSAMRGAGLPDISAQLVTSFLGLNLQHDLWYSRLPNGKTVILVRADVFAQISEGQIAEHVHQEEVSAAIVRGEKVPAETVRYYREKAQPVLADVGF